MTKKEFLLAVLWRLQPYWASAEGIILLLQQQEVNESVIDGVLHLIAEWVRKTESQLAQQQLQAGQRIIKRLRESEHQDVDKQEADDLLASLEAGVE